LLTKLALWSHVLVVSAVVVVEIVVDAAAAASAAVVVEIVVVSAAVAVVAIAVETVGSFKFDLNQNRRARFMRAFFLYK
jgi:hypothetical protein